MDKNELIITVLQQKIGELAAQNELEKAMLRAEYTDLNKTHEQVLLDLEKLKEKLEETSKLLDISVGNEEYANSKINELQEKNKELTLIIENNVAEHIKKTKAKTN